MPGKYASPCPRSSSNLATASQVILIVRSTQDSRGTVDTTRARSTPYPPSFGTPQLSFASERFSALDLMGVVETTLLSPPHSPPPHVESWPALYATPSTKLLMRCFVNIAASCEEIFAWSILSHYGLPPFGLPERLADIEPCLVRTPYCGMNYSEVMIDITETVTRAFSNDISCQLYHSGLIPRRTAIHLPLASS